MATVADIRSALERIAPSRYAEEWDNVGLQVGAAQDPVLRVMVALEMSTDVLAEAAATKAQLVVTHHPLLFRPRSTYEIVDPVSRLMAELVRRRIALLAAHTNLDSVRGGTNEELADRLGLAPERRFLRPIDAQADALKFAVFVPATHLDAVTEAIAAAGAGVIGKYTHCTFRSPGTGTYKPGLGANPFTGVAGRLEQAAELRVEALCPKPLAGALVAAVRAAHPYEEMAFDFFELAPDPVPRAGLGLVGALPREATLAAFAKKVKRALGIDSIGVVGEPDRVVRTVSLCTGSGGEFVRNGEVGGADVFVTGEMSHHDCWEAMERGIAVLLVGHFASEAIVCERLRRALGAELHGAGFEVEVGVAALQPNPLRRL
ncbi:MAG: Nif3-like dinuclear metal center hexameric protein [Candidatus Sumerlaeia bacterium]|nr:Nif3-like dinuclear metal center hexameric protein [Candidatus Sumerlaeia bacterium]